MKRWEQPLLGRERGAWPTLAHPSARPQDAKAWAGSPFPSSLPPLRQPAQVLPEAKLSLTPERRRGWGTLQGLLEEGLCP